MRESQPPPARNHGLPRTESAIAAVAAALGMHIPDACMAGVIANLALLDSHADRLLAQGNGPCG